VNPAGPRAGQPEGDRDDHRRYTETAGTDAGPQPTLDEIDPHGAERLRERQLREQIAIAAVPALLNYALTHRALNDCILQVAKDAWRVADAVIASNEPVGA
jgi:hypothetical protein